jgi:hypothetical protein
MEILATSFPHYVKRIEAFGVKAVYNPLAFDDVVFERLNELHNGLIFDPCSAAYMRRIHDCTFVGGVGAPSHWRYGMEVLNAVAEAIPSFKWWGYGAETLPTKSLLRQKYQGQAWGRDMYQILLQSRIVINRHGEVAEGFSNNMKLFESTGAGALLLTEESPNIWDLFQANEVQTYLSPSDAVDKINYYLYHEEERAYIAANGQRRTLKDHTYQQRMKIVSDTLSEMLCLSGSAN